MPSSSPGHSWSSGEIVQGHPRRSVGNLITFTGISTAFNIAHSSTGFLYQASHAFPPISLCVSVKLLMSIIWSDLTAGVTSPVTASPQLADKEDRRSQIRRAASDITRGFGGNVANKNTACMFIIIISREQLKKRIVFDRKLNALKKELETDSRVPEHEKLYLKYFTCKTTPKRGTKVIVNKEEINKATRYFGFFSLITSETMDAVTVLELYRNKDVV